MSKNKFKMTLEANGVEANISFETDKIISVEQLASLLRAQANPESVLLSFFKGGD